MLIYLALVGGFIAARPAAAAAAIARAAPILLIPLYELLSTFWSIAPRTTLYYGAESLLTAIAAILVGGGAAGRGVLRGIVAAFLLWGAANLLFGLDDGALMGGWDFVGLAGSKNAAGDAAALGLVVATAALADAVARRRPLQLSAALMLLLVDGAIVAAARSAGAVIAGGIGVLAVLAWSLSRALPIAGRSMILVATLAVTAAAAATGKLWSQSLFSGLLALSGKDTTLTGRTYIWSRAHVLIEQRPWFGLGYSAFWQPGSLEAEAIWRKLFVRSRSGFHFHNSALDILVPLGYVGLALIGTIFLFYGVALLLRTMRRPEPTGIFFSAVMLSFASRTPFESFGTAIFHQNTLLLFGALAWGTRLATRAPPSVHAPARGARR